MPIFGAYETVSEISRGAICSVWTARKAASQAAGAEDLAGPTVFALKICQPDIDIAGIEQAQRAVEEFLEQVDAQRRLAGLPNTVWAPVHDAGRADVGGAGAYYVTDVYSRGSLGRLVTSRVRPDARMLYSIVSGVLAGIRQIRDFLRRPHGNLHAGNVLTIVEGSGGAVAGIRVLLIDPAATRQLRGRTDSAVDLRALGGLLYLLVTHQEYHERSGWPIADSADWKRLPGGEKWRALCNRLLDPNPGSPPTVEEIEQTLLNLGATGGKGKGKLMAIGAAALVLVAGGVAAYVLTRKHAPPPAPAPAVTPASWGRLVDEYNSWFTAFTDDAVRLDDAKAKALGDRAPEFKGWLEALRRGLPKNDPWKIAGVPKSVSLEELKKSPPVAGPGSDASQATSDLLGVIDGIKNALKSGDWSLAKEAKQVAALWKTRGWEAGAEQISTTLGTLKADGSLIHDASALAAVLDKAAQVEKARAGTEPLIAHIDDETKKMGGDKVLGAFRSWADAYPGRQAAGAEAGAAIDTLAASEERVRSAATAVAKFLDSTARRNVCFDELGKSEFYAKFAAANAGPEAFEDWASEAKKQRYANPSPSEDPRAGKDIVEPLGRLAQELDKLKKNGLTPTPESLQTLDALGTALGAPVSAGADTGAKVGAIRERAAAIKGLAWDCRTRQEIEGIAYDAALRQMDDIGRAWRAENARKEGKDLADLARLEKLDSPVRDSESIKAWWGEHRAAAFKEADEAARFDRATGLEARLVALDGAVPRWTAPAAPSGREGAWLRNVERAALQRRDAMIGDFLRARGGKETWTDGEQHALGEAFSTWAASLDKIVASALGAEQLMNAGYGLGEAPASGGKGLQELAHEMGGGAGEQVKEALAPVTARIDALRGVGQQQSAAALAALVVQDPSNQPELSLAAWRKLGQVESWPAAAADLEKETKEFRAALRAVLNHEAVAPRREELTKEISAAREARWEAFVKRATTEADLDIALDPERTLSQLEVDPAKASDPLVRYRVAVHELKKGIAAAGVTDQQTKAAVEQFAGGVPADLASNARVAPLLDELRKAVADTEAGPPKVDPKTLGPGSLAGGGWTAEEAGGDQHSMLRFTKGGLKLEFLRVEAGAGVPEAFYLATDEVSIGEFAQIIDTAGAGGWQAIQTLMPTVEDFPPEAPRGWRWATTRGNENGKVAPAGEWLQSSRPSVGESDNRKPAYAPAFLRARSEGKGMIPEMSPRAGSPMQFVSPGAAVYAAALVGCRLPTPGEWQLAAGSGAPAEGTPNLRDQTWKVQLDYVIATRRQMSGSEDQFIWPDARVFPAPGAAVGEAAVIAPGAATDGWVWFAPVVEGASGFAHLRGNVAELVVGGTTEGPAAADAKSAGEFVNRRARDIAVIGASALSAPEEKAETPLPLGDLDALGGWSDVGFRLAFSATGTQAPRRSKAEVVAAILSDAKADPYLLKR